VIGLTPIAVTLITPKKLFDIVQLLWQGPGKANASEGRAVYRFSPARYGPAKTSRNLLTRRQS
jgi:hypothetical protein